jgi:hypothetical protein
MRSEIENLAKLGILPSESNASLDFMREAEDLIRSITKPVSDEEARVLTGLFGEDGCFGLAWSLLHLIESAPNWPLSDCLSNLSNEWIKSLHDRALRGGKLLN